MLVRAYSTAGPSQLTELVAREAFASASAVSCSPEDTRALAARLGARLQPGDLIALTGELGSGKTCFVQGLAEGMGIQGHITSPTFILMRLHPGRPPLCHADAYRLSSPQELEELGLQAILTEAVVAVEWAERVLEALPDERVEVTLRVLDDHLRRLEIVGRGERLAAVVREAFA